MPKSAFVKSLDDIFEEFGRIRVRPMFGGYGVYHDGLMFALVSDDVLYLRTDKAMAAELAARNLKPFEYMRQGERVQLAYTSAPAEIFDDPDEAKRWAQRAYVVAVVARNAVNRMMQDR